MEEPNLARFWAANLAAERGISSPGRGREKKGKSLNQNSALDTRKEEEDPKRRFQIELSSVTRKKGPWASERGSSAKDKRERKRIGIALLYSGENQTGRWDTPSSSAEQCFSWVELSKIAVPLFTLPPPPPLLPRYPGISSNEGRSGAQNYLRFHFRRKSLLLLPRRKMKEKV